MSVSQAQKCITAAHNLLCEWRAHTHTHRIPYSHPQILDKKLIWHKMREQNEKKNENEREKNQFNETKRR